MVVDEGGYFLLGEKEVVRKVAIMCGRLRGGVASSTPSGP